ncbi:hypothetical protein HYH03_006385 [Edaphochlamys debaryana]|uniref:Uncharacterized protein n=1 Tax=Edaphochlamys debaryana TaxID=47281 RepID=A0A835YDB3_9CHLO|nr:hypothetical protein HYH03_006385 [Edaphochlamys debaryana]|eukprot:KAG2495439.1 hypothetical protein HYH03_006385 [Edaphochlamys debaryana]
MCPNGCRPDPALDKYGRTDETPTETLIREALEYQELYHRERGSSAEAKAARVKELLAEIAATGSYTHTFDELQHGARVAWRHAPKCANRKFWEELNLLDHRHVDTPEGMFLACLELLEVATLSCVTTANIVVFRPQTPGTQDGPRVWNNQLLRYCGYKQPDGSVMGDKAETEFTTMLQASPWHQRCQSGSEFGWEPPPEDKRTRFDMLPLLLQANPEEEPKLFTLPPQYVARVPISHPDHPGFAELGLQWYAVPAVSALELSVGGLTYTACPFNGWYAVTEIVRNLTEEGRFDQCPEVAKLLGLSTKSDGNMWRDQAIVTVAQAVMHSFRSAGYGMVDHHTLMKNFWSWYHKETKARGWAPPGNWKWIIPPISPTASRCYLELAHMTEFTLKPGYWYAPLWRNYLKRFKEIFKDAGAAAVAASNHAAVSHAVQDGTTAVSSARPRIVIAYASVTGTTAKYAAAVAQVLSGPLAVTLLNMEDFEPDGWSEALARSQLVVLMLSTYGPGAPPSTAGKFLAWMQKGMAVGGDAHSVLANLPFTVLGFGCTSYPRFCAAADTMFSIVSAVGATPMMPATKVDSLSHEEVSVWRWARGLVAVAQQRGLLGGEEAAEALSRMPMTEDGKPRPFVQRFTLIHLEGVEGIRPAADRFRQEAAVMEVKELRNKPDGEPTAPATKQVVLDVSDLPGGGLSYLAGDELAVWGENPAEAVEAVAMALGISGTGLDSMFLLQSVDKDKNASSEEDEAAEQKGDDSSGLSSAPFPLPNSYRTILTRYVALSDVPSFEAVQAMALYAPEGSRLHALGAAYPAYSDWVAATATRWCDVWKEFPELAGRLPPAVFFQLVPVVKPRHYSISSSAARHPGQLHLTISRLAYRLPTGEQRSGFCSSFLASRGPGDRVCVRVLPTPGFRMPLDPSAPVIMVAAGTGIAPFKGFWEERTARRATARILEEQDKEQRERQERIAATRAGGAAAGGGEETPTEARPSAQPLSRVGGSGPCVLIFGCRSSVDDFIYRDTIQAALSEGALTRLMVAFSREPGQRKQYVQDVISESGAELVPLLQSRACHVYVCGSSNMAQEAVMAFRRILGEKEFTALVEAGRYHEDVFGMVVPDHKAAAKAAAQKGVITLLGNARVTEVAELLDGGGLSLDGVDHCGSTLLHVAAQAGNAAVVDLLLSRGCGANVLDMYGCTPLQLARLNGHKAVAAAIEAAGGRLASRLVIEYFPVHAAVMTGDGAALRKAIEGGANLAATEYHGLTPLHVACAVDNEEALKALIQAGAPLNATTRRGLLPLQLALALQRTSAAAILQAAGAPLMVQQVVTAGAGAQGSAVAWDPNSAENLSEAVGMSDEELAALQASWSHISSASFPAESKQLVEEFGVKFFLGLFEQSPVLLSLFPFKDSDGKPVLAELRIHGLKVLTALGGFVALFDNFPLLKRTVDDLVDRHVAYGVEMAHYPLLFMLLNRTLADTLGSRFDGPTERAWTKVGVLVTGMARTVYDRRAAAAAQQVENGAKPPADEAART